MIQKAKKRLHEIFMVVFIILDITRPSQHARGKEGLKLQFKLRDRHSGRDLDGLDNEEREHDDDQTDDGACERAAGAL